MMDDVAGLVTLVETDDGYKVGDLNENGLLDTDETWKAEVSLPKESLL